MIKVYSKSTTLSHTIKEHISVIPMLKHKAKEIRKHIIKMLMEAGSGHPGGSLSAVELVTTLYFYKMCHDPQNPYWEDRDRFILSKGHAAPLLYAVLAEAGYLPRDELKTLRKINSRLQGHPDRLKLPGVEMTTGSLGIGLSVAVGIALAGELNKKNYNVYVLLGDGEVQEGQIWEAAMSAAHYRLGNLTAILDRNGLQLNGPTEKIMSIEPLAAKWKAFNWHLIEIDGYDFEQIIFALNEADKTTNKPTMILAHTTKGKGVSFMEWSSRHHGYATDRETLQRLLEQM